MTENKFTHFTDIAERFLHSHGFKVQECLTEDEARDLAPDLIAKNIWPVYFFDSDTTGEKGFEEFYTENEEIDLKKFKNIGVIKGDRIVAESNLDDFLTQLEEFSVNGKYSREDLINLVKVQVPEFSHLETGKFLDDKCDLKVC